MSTRMSVVSQAIDSALVGSGCLDPLLQVVCGRYKAAYLHDTTGELSHLNAAADALAGCPWWSSLDVKYFVYSRRKEAQAWL